MIPTHHCPVCHGEVPPLAKKCLHCHNYLGFSGQWLWEEGVRVLGLLAMVAAAVVAWKSLAFTLQAQREKEQALAQAAIALSEREALKEDLGSLSLTPVPVAKGQDKPLLRAMDRSNDMRVRQLLSEAMSLRARGIEFRMGGKSPDDGFDSSGFVSYLLASAGAIDPMYHRTFSAARLEKAFPKLKPEAAKPGDLVFLGGSFVAFYLGEGSAIGIGGAKGIQVFPFSPKAARGFHRWAYEQDSRMLR